MNGGDSAQAVGVQSGLGIDGAIHCAANSVIVGRKRKHLNVVHHALDALDLLYDVLGVGFQRWPDHRTVERDSASFHFVAQIVETAVVRQHVELVPDLFDQPFVTSLRAAMLTVLSRDKSYRGEK